MVSTQMSISFPLPLNPPPPVSLRHSKQHYLLPFSKSYLICFSSSSSSSLPNNPSPSPSPSHNNKDVFLWLREEQRWLREEQRWLREEQRWLRERQSLLDEIQSLKLQIQALEQRISVQEVELVPETIATARSLLQVLNEKNRIAESGSSASQDPTPSPTLLEEKAAEEEVKEVIRVSERKRIDLRKGSEGDEVREMQEALLKLGFYSGEEDMEFSSFSSGTERAVKTWQATLGAREDGIMTAELLERLYNVEEQTKDTGSTISLDQKESSVVVSRKGSANGAAVASVTEISETQQRIVKDKGAKEVKATQHRVFLLGENRWEEPSRLVGRDKQVGVSKPKDAVTKCLSCRGEGRLLCTECDGTGEPNIEPQFLEWVDEAMKCPYCEGLGYTICDVCQGKTVT